jgi:hypothetical protein
LKVAKKNVSPASSEIRMRMKSASALLKWRNGMYRVPVIGSTYVFVNCTAFCGLAGFGQRSV